MGYTTDFVGHLDIAPALNQDEVEYLVAFSGSRRYDREQGPYFVPGNPAAETAASSDRYNRPAPGQPQLWCQWVPCWDGCCLAWDGQEKFYEPVAWLRYLISHFLAPNASASRSGQAQFEHFGFDHVVNGLVVGSRRDDRELFGIRVRENKVSKQVLRKPDPNPWLTQPLPAEITRDRRAAESRRRIRHRPDGEPGEPASTPESMARVIPLRGRG